jgi:hypothetical protein
MSALPRLRRGLLRHQLDNQSLIYDPRLERIHLLDPTTAFVFDLLEEGKTSLDMMTGEIARRHNVEAQPALVSLALDELRAAGLFDESEERVAPLANVSRREMVRKLAVGGAAALLVPGIATLSASRSAAQGISISGGAGNPCTASIQCGPGLVCCQGICTGACGGNPTDPCTSGTQCNSTYCCGGQCSASPCGTLGACENCFNNAQCQGGVCSKFGSCGIGNDADKASNGQPCNGNGNCCSNHCTANICTAT